MASTSTATERKILTWPFWRRAQVEDAAIPPQPDDENVPVRDAVSAALKRSGTHLRYAALFSAAINLLYLAPSLYMLQVYDRVLVSGGLLTLVFLSIAAVVALLVLSALDALRSRIMARMSVRLDRDLAGPVMRANFAARSMAQRDVSAVRDLDSVRSGVTSPGAVAFMDVPWTPIFVLICFVIHPVVGVVAVIGAVAIFAVALMNDRASRKSLKAISEKAPGFYGGLESDLRMAEAARSLGMRDALVDRRLQEREALVGAQTEAALIGADYSSAAKFVRMFLQSATLGVGAYLAVNQEISGGAIIAVTILTARAFAPIEQVVAGWRQTQQAWLSYGSLKKAMADFAVDHRALPLPAAQGRVTAEALGVRHQGAERPALQSVSFDVPNGNIVAIVGPSGAGKSTLARLLANASSPQAGFVRLDGAKYSDWPVAQLASSIGYLPQTVDLLSGTVAENIARFSNRGRPMSDELAEKVVAAAKAAGAHEMILRLPNAYDTPVGAGGVGLSLGQGQRIGLARALFGDPAVLVLDEPNAHTDEEGEMALIEAMNGVKARGGTVFVVAHRARAIEVSDLLMVIRDGVLLEFGQRQAVQSKLAAARAAAVQALRPRAEGGPAR